MNRQFIRHANTWLSGVGNNNGVLGLTTYQGVLRPDLTGVQQIDEAEFE